MEQLKKYAEETGTALVCEELKKKPVLDIFEKRSLQMRIAWAAAKRARADGLLVESLGPAISSAWKVVKQPKCPLETEAE